MASKPDPHGQARSGQNGGVSRRHPETVRCYGHQGSSSFIGVRQQHVLWSECVSFHQFGGRFHPGALAVTPMQPFEAASAASRRRTRIISFDALIAQIHRQPLRWHLIVIVGQPGDPTNDATIAWPAGREQVDVGTLTLDRVESDETSAATDINFDPLVLPAGIAPSDDPLLSAARRCTRSRLPGVPARPSSRARSRRPT